MGAASRRRIPEATVARLPLYYRALVEAGERQVPTISSERLAELAGVNAAKVRKDLSYLGSYGTRGRRLRRRVPAARDLPRARPDARLAGRHRRHRQPGSCARELPRLRRTRVPRRGARRRRAQPRRRRDRRPRGRGHRRPRPHRRRAQDRDRHPRRARGGGPGRVRPPGRGGRDVDPELRAGGRARSPRACRCARSTSPSSSRSCPSTSSGAALPPAPDGSEPGRDPDRASPVSRGCRRTCWSADAGSSSSAAAGSRPARSRRCSSSAPAVEVVAPAVGDEVRGLGAGWSAHAGTSVPFAAGGPRRRVARLHGHRRPGRERGGARGGRAGPGLGQQCRRPRQLLLYADVRDPARRSRRERRHRWSQPRARGAPAPPARGGAHRTSTTTLLDVLSEAREALRARGRSSEDADWQRAFDAGIVEMVRAGRIADAKELLKTCL